MCEEHQLEYNSRFKYTNVGTFYKLEWLLNDQDHPLTMMGDFESEDDFYTYVTKEINTRRFFLRKYSVAKMTDARITL